MDFTRKRAARRSGAHRGLWEAGRGLCRYAVLPGQGARMTQRGFALLAVLWVITALTALTGAGLVVARLGADTTRNRVLLARAEWAREACGEILQARFATDPSIRTIEPIDLGRGTWCRAALDDPAAKLNLNTADREALVRLFAAAGVDSTIADSVVGARRVGAIYDIRQFEGS